MNHICSVYEHQCLTYNIDSSTGNVTLMRYNATSKYQQWTINHETSQLVNMETLHCLEPHGKRASHGSFLLLQSCDQEKSKMKWSLNPVTNPTSDNRTQCAINQISTTRSSFKPTKKSIQQHSKNEIASDNFKNKKNGELVSNNLEERRPKNQLRQTIKPKPNVDLRILQTTKKSVSLGITYL